MRPALRSLCIGALALLHPSCGVLGGPSGPDLCKLRVVGIESLDEKIGAYDIEVRVRGQAGSPALVSLAARGGSGRYVSGYGVEVGPGPFEAIVEQKLTDRPAALVVLLELPGGRCSADVAVP